MKTLVVLALNASILVIPASSPQTHVVEEGDTLSSVAAEHDTDWVRIWSANEDLDSPDLIEVGQELHIPRPNEDVPSRSLPRPPAPVVTAPTVGTTPAPAPAAPATGNVWDRLAQCESGGNWAINTGNGYYGGLQFNLATWQSVGGTGYPHEHSRAEQIHRAQILHSQRGFQPWPACRTKLGLP